MPRIPLKRRRQLAQRIAYLGHQCIYGAVQEYWITHLTTAKNVKVDLPINESGARVKALRVVDQDLFEDIYSGIQNLIHEGFDLIKDRDTEFPDRRDLFDTLEVVYSPYREWLHERLNSTLRLKYPGIGDDMRRFIRQAIFTVLRTATTLAIFELKAWYDEEDHKLPIQLKEPLAQLEP